MYIQSNNVQQILQPLRFSQYDVNGTLQSYNQVTTVDPFQTQSSINFDLSKKNVALQGRTTLDTQMLANEELRVNLYVTQISNKGLLIGKDVFSEDDFYKDYCEEVSELPNIKTPIEIVDDIKNIINNPEKGKDITINIGTDLTVTDKSNGQVVSTIPVLNKNLPDTSKTEKENTAVAVPKSNKKNPTYWIYVVVGSAFLIGRLFKKIKK